MFERTESLIYILHYIRMQLLFTRKREEEPKEVIITTNEIRKKIERKEFEYFI
jgi:hypothetical protein